MFQQYQSTFDGLFILQHTFLYTSGAFFYQQTNFRFVLHHKLNLPCRKLYWWERL